jgi:TonB family protein
MRSDVRRSAARKTSWAALGAALVVHGTIVGTVHGLNLSIVGAGFVRDARAADATPDLVSTCHGDAMIAGGGRVALCGAPWRDNVDDCLGQAMIDTMIDLSSCDARNLDISPLAMISPHTAERVKQIDPEPLLEMLAPTPPKPEQAKPVPPPLPAPPAPPQPPQQAQRRPEQIVETAKPNEEQAPDNARFLAEYDTKVARQTVARGAVKEPMVAKSKPEELTPKENPKEASVKEQSQDRPRGTDRNAPDVPGKLAMRTPGARAPDEVKQDAKVRGAVGGNTGPTTGDGYTAKRGDGSVEQQKRERGVEPRGQEGAGGGAPPVPKLKPTQEQLERALGGGSVDHLEEVDSGDETALNAKRFIYASFFNRLKRSVAQNWDPATVWRRIDPTGSVNGFKTRVTEVRVSLSPKGELSKIVVTSPSGVGDLDDEAVRAFHAAAPFPNPPKELINSENLIVFAFSFYFEIGSSHTSWRVMRSM